LLHVVILTLSEAEWGRIPVFVVACFIRCLFQQQYLPLKRLFVSRRHPERSEGSPHLSLPVRPFAPAQRQIYSTLPTSPSLKL
jgi:hypothetical protein